jgi:acyl-coenzyme A synthetase/AMP-(fatty) acid ligase
MPQGQPRSLRDWVVNATSCRDRNFWALGASAALADLAHGSSLNGNLQRLAGRSVLIATREQLTTALALLELEGVARRLTLLPPDLRAEYLPEVIARAEIDAIVTDDAAGYSALDVAQVVTCSSVISPAEGAIPARTQTEWVLFTSGTTGMPKMVVHTFEGLTAAIKRNDRKDAPIVWGTYYDIRRYGGLQIFFRAVIDGGSLILSNASESVADHLARLGKYGVTHMTGTPSHWRRVLMSQAGHAISPQYVRLSGEIADQAILDALRAAYPQARIAHAYASTEAGVGFDVNDGLEGFPASMIGQSGGVQMKVADGTLRIRSKGAAVRYIGDDVSVLADEEGYIDTGDIVERRGDRYYFVGRKGGIINVGGLKVHPEEVEAIINRHPDVQMSLAYAKKNPITGAVVVADVVLKSVPDQTDDNARIANLRRQIMQRCRENLALHKVPATIRFVPALKVNATGKLVRQNA